MLQEPVGRPRVCDNVVEISRLVALHFPGVSKAGDIFPDYPVTAEDPTDIIAIHKFQGFIRDMVAVQWDLRLSYPALLTSMKKVYHTNGFISKHASHKANCQALILCTVCKHWLRDAKAQKEWSFRLRLPPFTVQK